MATTATTTATRKQGQKGAPMVLFREDLNEDERAIMDHVAKKLVVTTEDLTKLLGGFGRCPHDPTRPVRNALRRLMRSKILKRTDSGTYETGRKIDDANDYKKRASALMPDATKAQQRTLALVIAAVDLKTDTRVAKAIGESRGWVIPRMKRLRGMVLNAGTLNYSDDIEAAIARAEGV